jgi:putative transposase
LGSEERRKDPTYWRSKLNKDEVEMICYCLMPNHFHFLLKQNSKDGITKFMRRISNAYVRYFNKRYNRVGALFQGKFKAALIKSDDYLLHLSRYIHLNPLEVRPLKKRGNEWLRNYLHSSYPVYLGYRQTFWINPEPILAFFKKTKKLFLQYRALNTYKSFVEKYKGDSRQKIGELSLD